MLRNDGAVVGRVIVVRAMVRVTVVVVVLILVVVVSVVVMGKVVVLVRVCCHVRMARVGSGCSGIVHRNVRGQFCQVFLVLKA